METGLRGKTILLSGASGGIGSEIARMFDKESARLILTYFRMKEENRKFKIWKKS